MPNQSAQLDADELAQVLRLQVCPYPMLVMNISEVLLRLVLLCCTHQHRPPSLFCPAHADQPIILSRPAVACLLCRFLCS
jgi:hypothetical protein